MGRSHSFVRLRRALAALAVAVAHATPATAGVDALPLEAIAYHPPAAAIADPDARCRLDLRLPGGTRGFATLVWFHGGGLTGGDRHFPKMDGGGDIALVAAGYRLPRQADPSAPIEDAAAATAWVIKNIGSYGGDPAKVFIGGHSAGAYLASLVGMDGRWLKAHGLSHRSVAGILPVSGQATTHFHVKELRGIEGPPLRPVIDAFAPLHHASAELPPLCLILGDRRLEFKSRVEENELLAVTLRHLGHPDVEFHELPGLDHDTVIDGAARLMPAFITRVAAAAAR